jgi:glycosyltransferase involved in cell wall biosynthesis
MNLSRLYSNLVSKQSEAKPLPNHTPSATTTSHQSIQETVPSSIASRPTSSSKRGFLSQITPVILTWNEGPNLGRCLAELTWADQVIVLDSGSTDNTADIAARYPNVQWHQRPFDTHTDQWNHAIDLAPTPWVLTLDADYVVNADLVAELNALAPPSGLNAFEACFRYCVFGRPLRSSLYPPRALLFRRETCRYIQDGHTQLLDAPGTIIQLKTPISHDDRKPLSRWIVSQDKYAILETDKLLSTSNQDLRLQDRLRRTGWAAVPATIVYTLFVKRTILDGWQGWFYTLQRTVAEILLALRLLEKRLDP